MTATIIALLETIQKYLDVIETKINNGESIEVIRDKRTLKKATNQAEKIFDITDKYTNYFSEKDLKKYKALKKRFNKNN